MAAELIGQPKVPEMEALRLRRLGILSGEVGVSEDIMFLGKVGWG